jgi:hypothetical protein
MRPPADAPTAAKLAPAQKPTTTTKSKTTKTKTTKTSAKKAAAKKPKRSSR